MFLHLQSRRTRQDKREIWKGTCRPNWPSCAYSDAACCENKCDPPGERTEVKRLFKSSAAPAHAAKQAHL